MKPKAIFISDDGSEMWDSWICNGIVAEALGGCPCAFSDAGRQPDLVALPSQDARGAKGDLCPPCASRSYGNLGKWEEASNGAFRPRLHKLRLFKCLMGIRFVVPGLTENEPHKIQDIAEYDYR